MTEFIPPLELQTWMISVLSGSPEIFTALALFFISGMAGILRMSMVGMIFMVSIFFLMFSGFVATSLITLVAILGGLILGFVISNIFQR